MKAFMGKRSQCAQGVHLDIETYLELPESSIMAMFSLKVSYWRKKHPWSEKTILYAFEVPPLEQDTVVGYISLFYEHLDENGFDQAWIDAIRMEWAL